MDPRVKVSAAEGLLHVENDSSGMVEVEIGGVVSGVSPGCQKNYTLPEGAEYCVLAGGQVSGQSRAAPIEVADPEATAPPLPPHEHVGSGGTHAMLVGSSVQPGTFEDIMVLSGSSDSLDRSVILASALNDTEKQDFRVLQLGDVVRDAFERAMVGERKATLEEWNEIEQAERERAIAETLEILRAAARRAAGEPQA